MNLSLIPTPPPARRKTTTLAKVYTKDGRSIRVPLRAAPSTTCTTCSQNPERQFIRWFTRQSAANPGFPVMVKSILLVADQKPCANCQRILTSFLYRYNLAGKLRLGALQSGTTVDQEQAEIVPDQEFEQENDQELSRRRPYRPVGRSRTAQRSRVGTGRSSTLSRRGRSVVHILRRPLITGYQPDPLPDSVPDTEPVHTCTCGHTAPEVTESNPQNPDETMLDELLGETALSDEGFFRSLAERLKKWRAEKALRDTLNQTPKSGSNPYDANPKAGRPAQTAPAQNPANLPTPPPRGPYR